MSVLSFIEKYFAPPRYLTLPSLGVDISDTSLKYIGFIQGRGKQNGLILDEYGAIPIDHGALERGVVHDATILSDALRELRDRTKVEYVSVSLPEERAYLFEIDIPSDIDDDDAREFLEFKLEENVPLSPKEAYFDHTLLSKNESGKRKAVVSVYSRDTIDAYYEACVRAKLVPLAFEIEAQALARAVVPRHTKGATLIVDFGKHRMGIGIVYRSALVYASTLDISGDLMSASLRAVLGEENEDALTILKNEKGLSSVGEDQKSRKIFERFAKDIASELSIRMHYWHTRDTDTHTRALSQIILAGGSANLKGLPEYLRAKLEIPVVRANVWQNAFSLEDRVPKISLRESYGYAPAIGLALRGRAQKI